MKNIFLTFLLFLSTQVHAQKNLSPQVFQSNVRPVLNGIINDFYQMISLFPDFPKEIIKAIEQMDNMEDVRENLKTTCGGYLTEKCQASVDALRLRLAEIEASTLNLMARQRPAHSPYMTSLIGMRMVSEFQLELQSFKGSLDNASFMMRAKIKSKKETYAVIRKIDELQSMLSLAVVEFIPYLYKEDFRTFYSNFVHPVEIQLAKHRNHEFLNRNLNSLNFSINLLNQNLTKRSKKTPEGMAPFLSLIHNRWNSLLRYYF
ncbi:MAG TPA: hypothetical protein VNJ08_16075 [Bacteriovoracaceae bacterium]|nr:hypothetical protein [Bacteriovoracaceae bacterium]